MQLFCFTRAEDYILGLSQDLLNFVEVEYPVVCFDLNAYGMAALSGSRAWVRSSSSLYSFWYLFPILECVKSSVTSAAGFEQIAGALTWFSFQWEPGIGISIRLYLHS
jgi:hypothetical protein